MARAAQGRRDMVAQPGCVEDLPQRGRLADCGPRSSRRAGAIRGAGGISLTRRACASYIRCLSIRLALTLEHRGAPPQTGRPFSWKFTASDLTGLALPHPGELPGSTLSQTRQLR